MSQVESKEGEFTYYFSSTKKLIIVSLPFNEWLSRKKIWQWQLINLKRKERNRKKHHHLRRPRRHWIWNSQNLSHSLIWVSKRKVDASSCDKTSHHFPQFQLTIHISSYHYQIISTVFVTPFTSKNNRQLWWWRWRSDETLPDSKRV